jgi:nucleoside-diphosphate-sugar epimerase
VNRVLVTGASGFVGRHVLNALESHSEDLHALSRRDGDSGPTIRWHVGDLLEPGTGADLIESVRPSHLVHLAWTSQPGEFWDSPENAQWVARSQELLEAFAAAGGERALVSGSCAEYDWSGDGTLRESATPLKPATPYGEAKLQLSEFAAGLATRTAVSVVWARLFFLFGPGEHPDRLVASVARRVVSGEPAPAPAGTQARDYLYVEDAGGALASLLASSITGPVNVASGTAIKVSELLEDVAAEGGHPDALRLGAVPTRAGEPPRLTADVGRLTSEVGWRGRTPHGEAIRRTVAWWREGLGANPARGG